MKTKVNRRRTEKQRTLSLRQERQAKNGQLFNARHRRAVEDLANQIRTRA